MLDYDLAEIYGYTTMAFNQQVKHHYERFPKDFMFTVSPSELSNLSISQNVISIQTAGVKGGRSKPIHAFTEQGIYMLMTVLRGPLAEVFITSLYEVAKCDLKLGRTSCGQKI